MSKVALVVGAGDATGGAIARKFASEGYIACVVRRKKESLSNLVQAIEGNGGRCVAYGCDARDEDQVVSLVRDIETNIGEIHFACHNIGANVNFPIVETTSRVYRKVWEMAAFSAFLVGREVATVMLPRKQGTLVFTGATARIRANSGFAAFAGAKFALRALAQSMAKELGPHGIHVIHPIIDGPIDTAFIRDRIGNDEMFSQLKQADLLLNPDAIANEYFHLHQQPRAVWTHELDLRPYGEKF